jgi:copper chaperone
MEILVFKTNIRYKKQLVQIGRQLEELPGILQWNVDMQDCDKVLRIQARNVDPQSIARSLQQAGYACEELT